MHAGRDIAQNFERRHEVLADAGLRPFLPFEQHDVARDPHALVGRRLNAARRCVPPYAPSGEAATPVTRRIHQGHTSSEATAFFE